jgi:hypothetical protein
MALDTNTFLIVLAAAVVVMGFVVWIMFKKTSSAASRDLFRRAINLLWARRHQKIVRDAWC